MFVQTRETRIKGQEETVWKIERYSQLEWTNGSCQRTTDRLNLLVCRDDLPLTRKFWLRRIVYAGRNAYLNCLFFMQYVTDRFAVVLAVS
jgi:hypothetical protein